MDRPPITDRRGLLAGAAALWASSAVAEPAPPFTVGAIADCQYADEDDNGQRMYRRSPAKLKTAVDRFNTLDLDHVVHLGDFIDRDWASFDALQPVVDTLRHPWRFVLGNHEFAVADDRKPLLASRLGMPGRYYSFETRGWLFLALDGNDLSEYGWPAGSPQLAESRRIHRQAYPAAPDWDGGVGPAQLRWMERELASAEARGRNVAIYCHFPAYPENPHNLWNAREVIGLIEPRRAVKVWINGHNHDGNYGEKAGIHYVNMHAMLDTEQTAYATIAFHRHKIEINGVGRQPSLSLSLR